MTPYFETPVTRLYLADAQNLPLADGSVGCVVTSPPYWGLRDYGLEPSVRGGEDGCEHEWGPNLEHPPVRPRPDHSGNALLDSRGGQGYTDATGHNQERGAFCRRCNAGRGTLGREPSCANSG